MRGHSPEVIWMTDPLSNESMLLSRGKTCGLAQCREEQMVSDLKDAITQREMRELSMIIILSSQSLIRLEYLIEKLAWDELKTIISPSLNPFRGFSLADMDYNEREYWCVLRL